MHMELKKFAVRPPTLGMGDQGYPPWGEVGTETLGRYGGHVRNATPPLDSRGPG